MQFIKAHLPRNLEAPIKATVFLVRYLVLTLAGYFSIWSTMQAQEDPSSLRLQSWMADGDVQIVEKAMYAIMSQYRSSISLVPNEEPPTTAVAKSAALRLLQNHRDDPPAQKSDPYSATICNAFVIIENTPPANAVSAALPYASAQNTNLANAALEFLANHGTSDQTPYLIVITKTREKAISFALDDLTKLESSVDEWAIAARTLAYVSPSAAREELRASLDNLKARFRNSLLASTHSEEEVFKEIMAELIAYTGFKELELVKVEKERPANRSSQKQVDNNVIINSNLTKNQKSGSDSDPAAQKRAEGIDNSETKTFFSYWVFILGGILVIGFAIIFKRKV